MPIIQLPVPETMDNITRPVVMDIVRELSSQTGIPANSKIFFPGDQEQVAQQGSTLSDRGDADPVRFNNSTQIKIDVSEEYVNENMLTRAVNRPENLFVFRDDNLGIGIRPIYNTTEITINFTYRARDKVAAIKWRDEVSARTAQYKDLMLFKLDFHYTIPEEMIYILGQIYKLRERIAPYGEDWATYFTNHSTGRMRLITNQAGGTPKLAVSETQAQAQAHFDFEGVPDKGERDNETDTWAVTFSLVVRYEKPVDMVMNYQNVVHNQLLPKNVRNTLPDQPITTKEDYVRYYSMSNYYLSFFETGTDIKKYAEQDGWTVPVWDEFIPGWIPQYTTRMMTYLVLIDPKDSQNLECLLNVPRITFPDALVAFMRSEAPYMNKPLKSIFSVTVYEETSPLVSTLYHVDSNLNVRLDALPTMRKTYRVRLALVTDLSKLDPAAKDRLREHGDAAKLIIKTIYGKDLPPNNGYVKRKDLDDIINPGTDQYMFTVQSLILRALPNAIR